MGKYVYPAVFTEDGDGFCIQFPDVDGCITQGDNLQDGLENASDALCLMLYEMEQEKKEVPKPSNPKHIAVDANSFVVLVACDTVVYQRYFSTKTVKKTVTMPQWLDELAKKEHVNFSGVLQEALMEKLHIDKRM